MNLLADDDQWYPLTAATAAGVTTVRIGQEPATAGDAEYLVIAADDTQNYRLRLVVSDGVVTVRIEQEPTVEAAAAVLLQNDSGSEYALSLVVNGDGVTYRINQVAESAPSVLGVVFNLYRRAAGISIRTRLIKDAA